MQRRSRRVLLMLAAFAVFILPVAVFAAGGFTDVDDDSTFKADIDWLASAGVTKGCNPPENTEFCPKDNVTREQMAAFMHRLADNKVVDAATAVTAGDADMVDGMDANQLSRVAYAVSTDNAWVGDGTNGDILSTSIAAPVDGFLVINASSDVYGNSVSDRPGCSITLDGVQIHSADRQFEINGSTGENREEDCVTNTVAPVTAGTYTVAFVTILSPDTGIIYDESALTVLFVPFDGSGNPPTDFTVTGAGGSATPNN